MSVHIPHSGNRKERLGQICLSVVLSSRMDLRTNKIPSVHLKYDLGKIEDAMFQDVGEPCNVIFCILRIEERDFDEFALVML
jgi:hypothetical protein